MAHTTPSVSNGQLTYFQGGIPYRVPVDSEAWWQWLASGVRCFRVLAVMYPFTVRREQQMYWRASCTHEKQKHSLYVGKTEMLTRSRLQEVTEALRKRIAPDPSRREPRTPSPTVISPLAMSNLPLDALRPDPQAIPTLPLAQQAMMERPVFAFDTARIQKLTARETEVMSFVAEGMTNAQIAVHLCITISTVKAHVSSICEKLGLVSRGQMIFYGRGSEDVRWL